MPLSGVFVSGSGVYPAGNQNVVNSDPPMMYGNSATAFNVTLQTAATAIPDDERTFFNHGVGTMYVYGTFAGALVNPYPLTQGNGITVKWSVGLQSWGQK